MHPKHISSKFLTKLPRLLFIVAIFIYLLVRLIGLEQFPIYFFSDEAIQTVRAADFVRDNFRSESQEFFPTYFKNSYQYNLGPSVYIQILPTLLFGRQISVTRATAVLFSLLTALAIGLSVKTIFNRKAGWLAILLLSLMPAWFLHSRTAFETSLSVSFYSAFWYCYVMYRQKNRRFIYPAAIFAALAFYSYSPAQLVVSLTILALFLNDFKYHFSDRKTLLKALLLSIFLILPYIRFLINHPGELINHMQIVGANMVADLTFWQKVSVYLKEYLRGLNPAYWFIPNEIDLPRHTMKGYAHLWQPAAPFILIGLLTCFRFLKQSPYRMILIALLVAPSGAALAQIGITRALFMVFPASLLATLGLIVTYDWLKKYIPFGKLPQFIRSTLLPVLLFTGLSFANIAMLVDSLQNGPRWYSDYGLYGMQYGAKQIFGEIKNDLAIDPQSKIVLTSGWANGTDVLARYFFPDPLPFTLGSVDSYIQNMQVLDSSTTLVMLSNEYNDLIKSKKFTDIQIKKMIPYPDGRPGFYFIEMSYVDNVEEIFNQEKITRHELMGADMFLQDGSLAGVHYSPLDMGTIKDVLDGDIHTIARSWEANPFQFVFDFQKPRMINEIMLTIGGEPTRIEVDLWTSMDATPSQFVLNLQETPDPRKALIIVNLQQPVIKADLRVYNLNESEPAHVHVWEIRFLPDQ
ncbi:MAG: hypothetical protein HGB14_00850 [Anaerolineaceae bacterium]|nr:hypothetical protein [Anaerolineaceae bacterium]